MTKSSLLSLALGLLAITSATAQDCNTWKPDSYLPKGEVKLSTFDTEIISSTLGPFSKETPFTSTYNLTLEVNTSFDLSAGDPLGIISASVGLDFSRTEIKNNSYTVTFQSGAIGIIGFTPAYICTTGTLTSCDGKVSDETETCAPWKSDGEVQGDYTVIQS